MTARLPEAYQWLLVPGQTRPDAQVEWLAMRLSGQGPLAARASRKLKGDELLVTGFAATRLRMELDRVPLWRGDDVPVKQIIEDFARYLYLPRVADPTILLQSMNDGVALLTWEHDAFGLADSFDDEAKRYRGPAWRTGRFVVGCRCTRLACQAGCRAAAARRRERRACWSGTCCPWGRNEPDSWCRTGTRSGSTRTTKGGSAYAVPRDRASRLDSRGP